MGYSDGARQGMCHGLQCWGRAGHVLCMTVWAAVKVGSVKGYGGYHMNVSLRPDFVILL